MRYRQAAKLHNGDEVIDKRTGEIVRIISVVTVRGTAEKPCAIIEAVDPSGAYVRAYHTEVK